MTDLLFPAILLGDRPMIFSSLMRDRRIDTMAHRLHSIKRRGHMDDNRPAGEQGSKNAIENESPGERLEAGTDKVTREVQQEVAAAEERIGAGTDKVVEEAGQEVAAARRPWYHKKNWG